MDILPRVRRARWVPSFAVGLAATFAALFVHAAPLEKRFSVVLVPEGRVLAMHLGRADRALREGIRSAGGELLDAPSAELARAADPVTGECAEDCERQMRDRLVGGTLVLARVTTIADRFIVRVNTGDRAEAETGFVSQLEDRVRRLGARIASSGTVLVLNGGAKDAAWFVDGKAIVLPADRTIAVTPGRHVVRIGAGRGTGALRAVEVALGDRLAVTFPEGVDGQLPGTRRSQASVAATAPSGAPTIPPPARPESSADAPWTARTGFAFVSRDRTIAGSAGTGYGAQFFGGGPEVSASFRPAPVLVRLDLSWTSYQVSTARFPIGGGESRSAHGGDSTRARGMIGYERAFGERWRFTASGGAGWESHRADDPGSLGLLSSYQRMSAETEAAAAARVGAAVVGAHVGVTPWSSLEERPAGTSGNDPRPGIGLSWGLQYDWGLGDRWKATLGYRGELRSTRFSGTARAPVSPSIERATVQEFFNSVALSIGRRF